MRKRARNGESGFVLLLVFMMAAVIAIGLYAQLPRLAFEAQRAREQLLIERGEQYKRAIQLFVRKHGRYPGKIEELENTNNVRFLRRRYVDPMTGKDEWRLIHAGPGGVLTDSIKNKKKEGEKKEDLNKFITESVSAGMEETGPALPSAALRRRASEMPGAPGQPGMPGQMPPPQEGESGTVPVSAQVGAPGQPGMPGMPGQPDIPGQPGMVPLQPGMMPVQPGMTPVQPGMTPVQPGMTPVQPGMIPVQPGMPPVQPGNTSQPGFFGQAPPAGQQRQQTPAAPAPFIGGAYLTNEPPTISASGSQGRSPVSPPGGQMAPTTQTGAQAAPGLQNAGQNQALQMLRDILMRPRPQGAPVGATPTGQGGQVIGAGIAGIASTLEQDSIIVYDEAQKYNEWEFVYEVSKDRTNAGVSRGSTMGTPNRQGSGSGKQQQPGFGSSGGGTFGSGGGTFGPRR